MLRTTLLITAAAALFATSAMAESVHVSVVGKDDATLYSDIVQAAHQVCATEARTLSFDPFSEEDMAYCVSQTVKAAVAVSQRPTLVSYKDGERRLLVARSR